MIARIFLGLQALIFIPYGMYCLVRPEILAGSAGITAITLTGIIELQAMYGGLQAAVGVLCALGAYSLEYQRTALVAMLFLFAGLAVPRVSLALMRGDFSAYTVFAMSYEAFCTLFLLWLIFRQQGEASRA